MDKTMKSGLGILALLIVLTFVTLTLVIPALSGFDNYSDYKKGRALGFANGEDYEEYLKITNLAKNIGIENSAQLEVFEQLNGLSNPDFEQRVSILASINGLSDATIKHGSMLDDGNKFSIYTETIRAAHSLGYQQKGSPELDYTELSRISNPNFSVRVADLKDIADFSNETIMQIATADRRKYASIVGIISALKKDPSANALFSEQFDSIVSVDHTTLDHGERIFNKLYTDLGLTKYEAVQALNSLTEGANNAMSDSSLRRVDIILNQSPFTPESAFKEFLDDVDITSVALADNITAFDETTRLDSVSESLGVSTTSAKQLDQFYPLTLASRQRDYKKIVEWDGAKRLPKDALLQIMREVRLGNLSDYTDGSDQYDFCSKFWETCEDNSDLANNYDGWTDASVACEMATENRVRYGKPDWGGWFRTSFGTFYSGDSYVKDGTAILIEDDVKLQNGFGAMVRSEVECFYDLETEAVTSININ